MNSFSMVCVTQIVPKVIKFFINPDKKLERS